jgi:cell division protein FtsZ
LSVIRTGTHDVAYSTNPAMVTNTHVPVAASASSTTASSASMATPMPLATPAPTVDVNVPSVWRTNRTQAAARVDAMSSGGMDNYEIPAFLRKQAD